MRTVRKTALIKKDYRMTVLFEKRSDGVATVTLNRPEVLNALDSVAKQALDSAGSEGRAI